MKQSEYSRTLSYMEYLRLEAMEADTAAEAKNLMREYRKHEAAIAPYALGKAKLEQD